MKTIPILIATLFFAQIASAGVFEYIQAKSIGKPSLIFGTIQ